MPRPEAGGTEGRIGDEWRDYFTRIMPFGAGLAQTVETRRAFYAGAFSLLHLLINAPETDPALDENDDEAGARLIEDFRREILAFGESVKAGKA